MVLVEIVGDIINRIAICLFNEVGSRVSHGYNSIGYVGEVKLLPVKWCLLLWTSHNLANHRLHSNI
jgi:hypothetical protein